MIELKFLTDGNTVWLNNEAGITKVCSLAALLEGGATAQIVTVGDGGVLSKNYNELKNLMEAGTQVMLTAGGEGNYYYFSLASVTVSEGTYTATFVGDGSLLFTGSSADGPLVYVD